MSYAVNSLTKLCQFTLETKWNCGSAYAWTLNSQIVTILAVFTFCLTLHNPILYLKEIM
jgi:hypothetical protein